MIVPWVSVEEGLPTVDLVCWAIDNCGDVGTAYYILGDQVFYYQNTYDKVVAITHWAPMELPEGPTISRKERDGPMDCAYPGLRDAFEMAEGLSIRGGER